MDQFTVIDNVEKFSKESVISSFDNICKLLKPFLRGKTFALDSTIIETKSDFPGCGKTKRKNENGDDTDKIIYGFKLFILYEIKSRIIVAIDIVPANESDHKYLLPMIKKGIKNCGKSRIKLVIADRGFLCGSQMWELKNKMDIDFIIPAKVGMEVRTDAISLRKKIEKNSKRLSEWKYGKGKCQGYGVEGLLSYLQYNPTKTKNNRKTNGSPINGVVVTKWRDKSVTPGKETVFLTSLPTEEDASIVANGYRQRSLIENCGFRELKQASYLSHLPRRKGDYTENAAYIHIIFCALAHSLFYAFLIWRKKNSKENNETVDCMRGWRRNESITNEKTILIIAQERYYALFDIVELLDIFSVKQKYRIQLNC